MGDQVLWWAWRLPMPPPSLSRMIKVGRGLYLSPATQKHTQLFVACASGQVCLPAEIAQLYYSLHGGTDERWPWTSADGFNSRNEIVLKCWIRLPVAREGWHWYTVCLLMWWCLESVPGCRHGGMKCQLLTTHPKVLVCLIWTYFEENLCQSQRDPLNFTRNSLHSPLSTTSSPWQNV